MSFQRIFQSIIGLTLICIATCSMAQGNIPSPQSSAQSLDQIIAVVNNDIISQSQLDQAVTLARQQMKHAGAPMPPISTLKRQILQQLINQQLQLQLAKRNNVKATTAQVNSAIARIAKQNRMTLTAFMEQVHSEGLNTSEFRALIQRQILVSIIQSESIGKEVHVSAADVSQFLAKYKKHLSDAKEYHVSDILVPIPSSATKAQLRYAKSRALAMIKALQRGITFNQVAAGNENDLGWRAHADLPSLFANKVTTMKIGQTAGPLRAGNGFHIIKLLGSRNLNTKMPSSTQVRQIIFEKKFTEKLSAWLKSLRKTAYIKVLVPQ